MTANVEAPVRRIPREIVDGFADIGVGDIGHILQFGFMDTAIRPIWRDIKLVGTAFTVRMPSMDTMLNRQAIMEAQPGDVLVVDRGGDTEIACFGGETALLAQVKGIAGMIVDGAVTDSMEISDLKWPVYTRSLSGVLGRKLGKAGEMQTTVSCGGVPVSPGDLIVADDDGIVVIRPHEAEELLETCRQRFGGKPNIRTWLRDGNRAVDYPAVKQFFGDDWRPGTA